MEINALLSTKDQTASRLKKSVLSAGVSPYTFSEILGNGRGLSLELGGSAQAQIQSGSAAKTAERPNARSDSAAQDRADAGATRNKDSAGAYNKEKTAAAEGKGGEAETVPASENGSKTKAGNGEAGNPDGKTTAETAAAGANAGEGTDAEAGTVVKALAGTEETVAKTTVQQIIQNAGLTAGLEIVAETGGAGQGLAAAAQAQLAKQGAESPAGAKAAGAAAVQPGQIPAADLAPSAGSQAGTQLRAGLTQDLAGRASLAGTDQAAAQASGAKAEATGQFQNIINQGTDAQTPQQQGQAQLQAQAAAQGQTELRRAGGESAKAPEGITNLTAAGTRVTNPAFDPAATLEAARSQRPAAQATPLTDQVAVRISKAVADGLDRINIQLRPAALGRVSVAMELGHDGRVQAVVTADNTGTLDMLKQDARGLEKALAEAGLKTDSGSLSFNLRGQEKGGDGSSQNGQGSNNGGDAGPGTGEGGEEIEIKLRGNGAGGMGLLDISV